VGLWSCNIRIGKTCDKKAWITIMGDLNNNLIARVSDDKQSLVARISRSKYLDDIVIYNPQYSILNESLTSHQPKRQSEGVLKKSIHVLNGCNVEGQGKKS
jgi:hypothetical protein